MRTLLEFNLPEEEEEFLLAFNGARYAIALDEMDNWLRAKIKYGDYDQATEALYQECRDKLTELTPKQ
jgi:hypothetical protein